MTFTQLNHKIASLENLVDQERSENTKVSLRGDIESNKLMGIVQLYQVMFEH